MTQTITRKQLQAYGMSKYHTQTITKGLTPVRKQGQAYVYDLSTVISEVKNYTQRSRVKKSTCELLEVVLVNLLKLLGNVLEIPFSGGSDPEVRKIVAKLMQAMAKTDASLATLEADADEIKQKYDMLQ